MGHNTDPPSGRVAHEPKARSGAEPAPAARPTSVTAIPRDFTLCREADLPGHTPAVEESTEDHMYGVESLDDVRDVPSSESAPDQMQTQAEASLDPDKRRKPGNPVHPSILAAGQKIMSSDTSSPKPHNLPQSPIIVAGVPSFQDRLRAISGHSTLSSSRKPSPASRLEEPVSNEPRSISPGSLRLSDDGSLILDETASQVILSSSGEEDEEDEPRARTPTEDVLASPDTQLVMPSLSLPARRPLTPRGGQMGHIRLLVAGRKKVGKSTFVSAMLDQCVDIVHSTPARTIRGPSSSTLTVTEISASTKAVPDWKRKPSRSKLRKASSEGTMALERNLSILEADVDCDPPERRSDLIEFVQTQARLALAVDQMEDAQLLSLLAGESTQHIDVVLYLLDNNTTSEEAELVQKLSALTNVIPILADGQSSAEQAAIESALDAAGAHCLTLSGTELPKSSNRPVCLRLTPYDVDTSIVWDSDAPSPTATIATLTNALLTPSTLSHLRHTALKSLIRARHAAPQRTLLPSPLPRQPTSATPSSPVLSCSTISTPSAVLLPPPTSAYYNDDNNPTSPSLSAHTIDSTSRLPSNLELALLHTPDPEPRVRIAQWALDLQRSLASPVPAVAAAGKDICPWTASGPSSSGRSRSRRPAPQVSPHPDPLRILRVLHDPLPFAVRVAGVGAALATLVVLAVRGWEVARGWWAPGPEPAGLVDASLVYGQQVGLGGMGWVRAVFA